MRCNAKIRCLLLAFGSNISGAWGSPRETFDRARRELERSGVRIISTSLLYATNPVGDVRQPRYLNAVALARTKLAPGNLLRLVKGLERRAGRKVSGRARPRPLDLDLIDYGGRRIGRPGRDDPRGRLLLPHPQVHRRAFVLVPLLDVAPHWRHPVLGTSARALLARLPPGERRGVRPLLDFSA